MNVFTDWLNEHLLTCPSKHFFHLDCPGCGFQRSIITLLEGDIAKSFQLYPATIPILTCFIFTALHIKFDFKYGAFVIKVLFILSVSTIVIFYLYKIFTHKLI
ncbi:MAG: DUF2752 domain-containing protein [Dysgonamonadaceae bacterium]|nr:DUF2752 domain-containing protein [Dysgonamonadaceae bacterium]